MFCNRVCKAKTFDVVSSARVSVLFHGSAAWSYLKFVSPAVGRCTKAVPTRHTKRELQPGGPLRYLPRKFIQLHWLGDVSMQSRRIQGHEDMRVPEMPSRLRLVVVRPGQRVLRCRGMQDRRCARDDAQAEAVCACTCVAALPARGRRLRPAADLAAVVGVTGVLVPHASVRISLDIHIKHASGFHTSTLSACLYCAVAERVV